MLEVMIARTFLSARWNQTKLESRPDLRQKIELFVVPNNEQAMHFDWWDVEPMMTPNEVL